MRSFLWMEVMMISSLVMSCEVLCCLPLCFVLSYVAVLFLSFSPEGEGEGEGEGLSRLVSSCLFLVRLSLVGFQAI